MTVPPVPACHTLEGVPPQHMRCCDTVAARHVLLGACAYPARVCCGYHTAVLPYNQTAMDLLMLAPARAAFITPLLQKPPPTSVPLHAQLLGGGTTVLAFTDRTAATAKLSEKTTNEPARPRTHCTSHAHSNHLLPGYYPHKLPAWPMPYTTPPA
jgi:hypothetical protein